MKKLMNRAGLLAAAFALALAVALALNAAAQTPEVAQAQTTGVAEVQSATCEGYEEKSHDWDRNGLIDICSPAQLNAIRYDLNGDGDQSGSDDPDVNVSIANVSAYNSVLGCGPGSCFGYELKADISLDDLPASDKPWTAIGPWQAVFDGNGFSITGLEGEHELFSAIGVRKDKDINDRTVVRNVDVVDADITLCGAGVLATVNHATIIGSYVKGKITCSATALGDAGGLVGANRGTIIASVADVDVKVTGIPAGARMRVGGFAGMNYGEIRRSYAYGNVIDARGTDVSSARPGAFKASGFANNYPSRGTIHWSFSYGDKIARNGSGENARVVSKSHAQFATELNSSSNSCAFREEWQFKSADCITD